MLRGSAVVLGGLLGLGLIFAAGGVHATPLYSPGPFVGVISQDEEQVHEFNNVIFGCPLVEVTYLLTLDYGPSEDTLNVSVKGYHLVGENGHAEAYILLTSCTEGDIVVGGESVESLAGYVVTLTRLVW